MSEGMTSGVLYGKSLNILRVYLNKGSELFFFAAHVY